MNKTKKGRKIIKEIISMFDAYGSTLLVFIIIAFICIVVSTMAYGTRKDREKNAALVADIQTKEVKSCILTSSSS